MAVVVISQNSAIIVTENIGEPQYFLKVLKDHYRYQAILVKCEHRDVKFYKDTLHDCEGKEGRVERFLDHIKRRGLDVVTVEKVQDENKIFYVRPDDTRYEVTKPAVIVKVDDSVDPIIAQRALDVWYRNSLNRPYPTSLVHEIEALVAQQLLPGKLTEIKFGVQ
jgi:hypothetical protein